MRFAGRHILVAGGGSIGPGIGNGKAAAMLYAREGAHVWVVDRNGDAAGATVSEIAGAGGTSTALTADLTEPEAVARTVAQAEAGAGRALDALHFNIGTSTPGGVVETDPADWDRVFDVNLRSAFLTARAVLPGMRAAGAGAMVFISSVAAIRAGPYSYVGYEASKAALERMAKSIARSEAPNGIRANIVQPGPIDTPHVTHVVAPDADPEALARARAAISPMGRQGTPWEVAEAAAFLLSDAASYITGVSLPVDGGTSL